MTIVAYGYGLEGLKGVAVISNVFVDDILLALTDEPVIVLDEDTTTITLDQGSVDITLDEEIDIEVD